MRFAAVIAALFIALPFAARADVREYDRVDFGPLHWLSKGDIILGGGILRRENRILADRARIEAYLSKESMVKSYKLIDKNNVLTILVSEREPACTVALRIKNRTILCEADRDGRLISSGRSYSVDAPLVTAFALEGQLSLPAAVKSLVLQFGELKKRPLWHELGQITLRGDGLYDVLLKGRPTVFTVSGEYSSFAKLEAVVAQLDRSGRYPKSVVMRDSFAVAGVE